jgi:DNA (cytosine-5)-methyltransferase 1
VNADVFIIARKIIPILAQMKTSRKESKKLKVAELFAGVGGFRLGLEGFNGKNSLSRYTKPFKSGFDTIWSNQWEPSTKIQHASRCYTERFGLSGHCNKNISEVDVSEIPDHDILVGGFPCQDYSVAKQLSKSEGIGGKKGVLWWDIHRIVSSKKPKYIFLENVDRLLKSPSNQRGRDFAIMLTSLSDLGYCVEWRVINAADYGFPQRRRRVFFVAYKSEFFDSKSNPIDNIEFDGVIANAFPINPINPLLVNSFEIDGDLSEITQNFNSIKGQSPFQSAGIIINRKVTTIDFTPKYNGDFTTLGDIVLPINEIPSDYFINNESMEKWIYLKGSKKEERKKSNGEIFYYTEGPLVFPDPLDKPARTIITSEGGSTPSRFKLVINQNGTLRRLHPIELERINMFPDNHTIGSADTKRAFFMGNALVVGVIEKIGEAIMLHHINSTLSKKGKKQVLV